MKKYAILLLVVSMSYGLTFAQDPSKSLEVRLSVIHSKGHTGRLGPVAAVGITFINKSNKDIYVPEIYNFSKDQSDFAVTTYKKDGSDYVPFSYTEIMRKNRKKRSKIKNVNIIPGSQIPGMSSLTSDIVRRIKEIDDKHIAAAKRFIEANNLFIDTTMFTDSDRHGLFLKAGEEIQYYYTIELQSSIYKEGEYVFEFKPDFTKTIGEGYPDTFMGYTKVVPTAVESNRVYLNLKSLDK